MDNTRSKTGKSDDQPVPANAIPVKMPKNVRQVGNIGAKNKVIYVEDYVMTFIKQLSDKEHTGCRVAVLLGYYVRTDEGKNIFIKGAVEMRDADFSNGVAFTDEGWTSIYESIKKYFTDVEIVGWSLIGPEFFIEGGDKIRKIHMENFSGPDKTLLKMDSMEKEEAFYLNENNQLVKQNGYYIYYEKNEEMQNYMVDSKEAVSEEKTYNDQTTRKIRTVIHEKKDVKEKDDKSIIRLLYASSALLAIIVLVIAATLLDNYDKMRNMETAINAISQNLSLVKDDTNTPEDNKTKEEQVASSGQTVNAEDTTEAADASTKESTQNVADNDADTQNDSDTNQEDTNSSEDNQTEVDNKGTVEVETVTGNIKEKDDKTDKPAKTESADNGKKTDNTDTAKNDSDNSQKEDDATPANAKVKYYTVVAGDSLASISFKLYNTFSYMDEIKELNGIENEDKILVGQKLIVP